MQITFEKTGKQQTIDFTGTGQELLKKLKLNPETVLLACNEQIIETEQQLTDKDSILIIDVVSGG